MSYTATNYSEAEERAPGMHFLRGELDCEELGFTVVDVDDEWEGMEHDHAEEEHEEVYMLVDGSGHLTVDGEDLSLDPGDTVRVAPDATRKLEFEGSSTMVIAGAP
jgi:mannose-6-phosphate isomerase-like protein (cupin superfamily)